MAEERPLCLVAAAECSEVDISQTLETQSSDGNTEVHNHCHMHDRRSIGHVSTGDDNRRDTRLGTDNQELVNQLEKDTLARITSWTDGMVKTAALQTLLSKIKSGSRWVTVRGSPGEGKTTMAYQALLKLSSTGRRVFHVWKPEELAAVLSEFSQPAVVMLDDMFGGLEFDLDKWKKWEVELHKILGVTEHHSLDRTYIYKKDIIVIIVGRDYVFNSATCNLGKYTPYFTATKHVVNMTVSYERDVQEKMSIWKTLSEAAGVELEKKTVEKICNIRCPHGFPHVCRLFITMYKEDRNLNAEIFFKSPINFLNQTVTRFMENDDLFEVFKELIIRDGKVSVRQLGQFVRSRKITKAADDLVGSYLKKANFVFEFDHPSILDSVAFHFCSSHLDIAIQKCRMSFLHERIRLESSQGTTNNDNSLVVYIPRSSSADLAHRFVTEISKRNFYNVLSHKVMRDVEFVKEFISLLTDPLQLMYKTDVNFVEPRHPICRNEGTFLYYISSSQSPLLLEHIERHTKTQLSTRDIETVLVGACRFAARDVLTYLMRHHNININMQVRENKQTPLMISAKSGDSGFVDTILDMKPDLSVKNCKGQTALYPLCYHGVDSAVSRVIDMGCDVNEYWYGETPLSVACSCNQTAVVRVLLDKGARIYSGAVFDACVSGNLDILTLLFDKGASVNSFAVEVALASGNLDIVTLLFDRGATVDMDTHFGSPLHYACWGRSLTVMEYLIGKGASVNEAHHRGLGTPLHMACHFDWHQGVRCLLGHGADIDSRDWEGRTPLHSAVRRGSDGLFEILINAGADIRMRAACNRIPLNSALEKYEGAWPSSSLYHLPDISVCQTLITQGVDVNSVDIEGNTALHLLCQVESDTFLFSPPSFQPASDFDNEFRSLVKMFVEQGADTEKRNKRGEPALRGWCKQLLTGKHDRKCIIM